MKKAKTSFSGKLCSFKKMQYYPRLTQHSARNKDKITLAFQLYQMVSV